MKPTPHQTGNNTNQMTTKRKLTVNLELKIQIVLEFEIFPWVSSLPEKLRLEKIFCTYGKPEQSILMSRCIVEYSGLVGSHRPNEIIIGLNSNHRFRMVDIVRVAWTDQITEFQNVILWKIEMENVFSQNIFHQYSVNGCT